MEQEKFEQKYCLMCGTQRCGGITDEEFRDGCPHYINEYLTKNPATPICPKCGAIAEYNSYYGRITCTRCEWEGNMKG